MSSLGGFSLIYRYLETSEVFKRVETHTHTQLLSDPHAIGPPVCNRERSQTTFLTPDGFVQTPWKPRTPQIHQRSARSRRSQQPLSASDIFISPLPFGFNLTCNLLTSCLFSTFSILTHFTFCVSNI